MKKFFLFTLLAFVFFIAPKVNAQVTMLYLFDANFNTVVSSASQCWSSNDAVYVRYGRFVFDDQLQANTPYTLNFQIGQTSYNNYVGFYWNGSSGINLNGTYIKTSPTAAQTLSQSVVSGNPSIYQKSSSFTFDIETINASNTNFFQVDFGSYTLIRQFCLNSWNIAQGGTSTEEENTQAIINNNNNNTQSIINNQNNNTTAIINNQNQNTQQEIDSQKVCEHIDKNRVTVTNKNLTSGGTLVDRTNAGVTGFIKINSNSTITRTANLTWQDSFYACFYNVNKEVISCYQETATETYPVPSNADYVRFSLGMTTNLPQFQICKNGNQALNDYITNSDIDIGGHVIDVPTTNHPISSIITAPISFLESLDDTCSPISFNLGFPGTITKTITLPCGDTIFWNRTDLNYVQEFRLFWNILFGGALLYFFGFKLFKAFEKALDPFETGVNDLEV